MRLRSRLTAMLVLGLLGSQAATGQPYGLDQASPVGPFLDGALPSSTPLGPGNSTWGIGDAFPALPVTDTLVIAANPAETDPATDRLYVGSRDGVIQSFPNDPGAVTADPFMDLSDRVAVVWDAGFLGLAFHPEFGVPGSPYERTFYAYYSSHCPLDAGLERVDLAACDAGYPRSSTPGFFNAYLRLSRFEVLDAQAAVLQGDPASEEPLLNIRLYNGSHRGGGPAFGLDGYLYLAIGDQFRYDTAQFIDDNLEGGMLRLAVDVSVGAGGGVTCPAGSHLPNRRMQDASAYTDEMSGRHYCIPDDNPWPSAGTTFEEYWSIGHRNPHRIAVDPVTGRIWSGEVGQSTREEINVISGGNNYGWPFREGLQAGPRNPPTNVLGSLTDPVIDFVRSEARAIIGGYVYRGSAFPELVGRYITGDYVTRNVWAVTLEPVSMTATADLLTTFTPGSLGTLGQDNQGEIFLGSVSGTHSLQGLVRLSGAPLDAPAWLSEVGAFSNLATLQPAPFFVPFEPVSFWSDGSGKWRWAAVPNNGTHDQASEQIRVSAEGAFDFPLGSVLMKHFELPIDDLDPSRTTRLETRFLVHGTAGWYGLAYRYLPDGSDAFLLADRETRVVDILEADGGTRQQTWTFPGRLECNACHSPAAGGPLGPRIHGLNRDLLYPSTGRSDNQLRTWSHLGLFETPLVEATIPGLPRAPDPADVTASLEARARSWLDANCSPCHQPGTTNRAAFDARFSTPLASQSLVWGPLMDDLGIPGAHVVTPGNPLESVAFQRAAQVGTPEAMPPLLKELVHQVGIDVLYDWIVRVDPAFPRTGVAYEYFELTGMGSLPDFDSLTPVMVGNAPGFDISLAPATDDFAFRFEGFLEVPTDGDWTFYTTSDDGSQLFIDGALVVDNDGLHSPREASGTVSGLSAGIHPIRVTFFERGGGANLEVEWAGPGVARASIPLGQLYVQPPTPLVNQPPTLGPIADQVVTEAHAFEIPLSTSDPDGDLLHVEVAGLPAGSVWQARADAVSATLPRGSSGSHTVTVGVSDGPAVAWRQAQLTVNTLCSNGIDDDGDGRVDWDGAGLGPADPQCGGLATRNREAATSAVPKSCGLGAELAPLLAGLLWARRRLGARRATGA